MDQEVLLTNVIQRFKLIPVEQIREKVTYVIYLPRENYWKKSLDSISGVKKKTQVQTRYECASYGFRFENYEISIHKGVSEHNSTNLKNQDPILYALQATDEEKIVFCVGHPNKRFASYYATQRMSSDLRIEPLYQSIEQRVEDFKKRPERSNIIKLEKQVKL